MSHKAVTLPKQLSDPAQWDKLIQKYKDFRLTSLRQSPESFSSTFIRELNFPKETWETRLKNLQALNTVIVSDPNPGTADDLSLILNSPWLGSLVLSGPLEAKTAAKTWEEKQNFEPGSTEFGPIADDINWAYVLNAIFVLSSERRKGLANKLIEYAKNLAAEENGGRKVMLVLIVNFNSGAAIRCYEKSGFEVVHEYWFDDPNGSGSEKGHAAVMRLDVGGDEV
ncbi:gnat family [Fusarium austroafricanum]|uniref:Gnat family n=1 Tax=Fusarium austroafricanum TaxID=2364996 RepID=A0A8H4NPN2_9HYPO|nr:gnat family [Fusarium austroafricanum]